MMEFRAFDMKKDYGEVCSWWRDHKWDPVPMSHLPDYGGWLVEEDGVNLAAGWLYLTGTKFAQFEWLVVNPNAPIKKRAVAIEHLIKNVTLMAKQMGLESIYHCTKPGGLVRMMERNGFKTTDDGMVNLIWRVS